MNVSCGLRNGSIAAETKWAEKPEAGKDEALQSVKPAAPKNHGYLPHPGNHSIPSVGLTTWHLVAPLKLKQARCQGTSRISEKRNTNKHGLLIILPFHSHHYSLAPPLVLTHFGEQKLHAPAL